MLAALCAQISQAALLFHYFHYFRYFQPFLGSCHYFPQKKYFLRKMPIPAGMGKGSSQAEGKGKGKGSQPSAFSGPFPLTPPTDVRMLWSSNGRRTISRHFFLCSSPFEKEVFHCGWFVVFFRSASSLKPSSAPPLSAPPPNLPKL